jgi:hypothetical protein
MLRLALTLVAQSGPGSWLTVGTGRFMFGLKVVLAMKASP